MTDFARAQHVYQVQDQHCIVTCYTHSCSHALCHNGISQMSMQYL